MFLGHFGAGFAAKKLDKRLSLGTLFLAAQWQDLILPVFLILDIERIRIDPGNTMFTPVDFVYYPFSHGFLSIIIWGALFTGAYFILKRNARGAFILGGLVLSHWVLDWIAHRPDLPIIPGSEIKTGLGLWNTIAATILVEGIIFFVGIFLYVRITKAKNRSGNIGLWSLIIFFILVYIMNLLGPPPPSEEPFAYVGLAQWLFVIWAYWLDRNRKVSV